jgi:hypothetical protein
MTMAVVIPALLVFLLIVLGFIPKRSLTRQMILAAITMPVFIALVATGP